VAGRQVVGGRIARFLVLDTNVLVSGLGWRSHPAQVLDAALEGLFTLVTSPALLEEVWRVLRYPRLAAHLKVQPYELLRLIVGASVVVAPSRTITVAPDPADNRVLEAAVAGEVDAIITGDQRHLRPLDSFEGIPIRTPAEFVAETLGVRPGFRDS
jgi:putative PIN family toxin of toxin-antitoxin system